MRSPRPLIPLLVLALALVLGPAAMAGGTPVQSYIVTCTPSCAALAAAVAQIPGAKVGRMFQNVASAVVTLPVTAVSQLQSRTDVLTVDKDVVLAPPIPERSQVLPAALGVQALAPAQVKTLAAGSPADYSFNNQLIGASTLQAQGTTGSGVVVGVIDSGIANNPAVVPALAGSVLGGETLLSPDDDPVTSATSTLNGPHGTWVSTVIAGHVVFLFDATSALVQALHLEAPGSVIPCSVLGCPSSQAGVPMVGVAPGASLYALKIFPSNSGGARLSVIAAAMDRAITLRKNFNHGVPSVPTNPGCGAEDDPCVYDSLPIQVVNMSVGGFTSYPGKDVEDLLTQEMLKAGITLVAAAGNSGPGALTTESPATGAGAISAAAASTPAHERLFWDLTSGLGVGSGALIRPFSGIQTASFSSRGPSADGRYDVDLSANGYGTFAQGPTAAFRSSPAPPSRRRRSPARRRSSASRSPPPRRSRSGTRSPPPATRRSSPTARPASTVARASSTSRRRRRSSPRATSTPASPPASARRASSSTSCRSGSSPSTSSAITT